MTHAPVILSQIGLWLPHKICFSDFSAQVCLGTRIALIGQNGSGKSTLLRIIQGLAEPSTGKIFRQDNVIFSYIPQINEDLPNLSGGQRFNETLTQALLNNPDILIMDEPTNHLDSANRYSLMRLLQKFTGTLIIASHDEELLRTCVDTFWHIKEGKITVFCGKYDDYQNECSYKRHALEESLNALKMEKKNAHKTLMKEQQRSAKSRAEGESRRSRNKWPTMVASAKAQQAQATTGRKKQQIEDERKTVVEKLQAFRLPEIIVPRFNLTSSRFNTPKVIVSIIEGACGYEKPVLENIFFSLGARGRVAINGNNGSGKSTLVKAMLNDPAIYKTGAWTLPDGKDIGYLDQHYATLDSSLNVMETIYKVAPRWPGAEVRRHLNDFLFRKNEEVTASVSTLSGGEKARLSLARIAARPPLVLILDEITNNLDRQTRRHVSQVLKHYPGAMIVISHDKRFVEEIGIHDVYDLSKRTEK